MADNVQITPGVGVTIAADDIGGVEMQRVKVNFGLDGQATDVSNSAPLPTTDKTPAFAAALTQGASISVATSSTLIVAANATRTILEITNTGSNTIWLAFNNSTAVLQSGFPLLSGVTYRIPYTGAVRGIAESAATRVGVVEW